MAKYIKHNSNYIRTDRHQFLKGGSTIFERDWVTIGSQLHFGPGKIPYYTDGNFLFTKSLIPFYQKKFKNGVNVATWTYEDVKDASSIVNNVSFDEYSEDIRSFAYYGSCVELVRTSIENIIKSFPGMIVKNNYQIQYQNRDASQYIDSGYYEIKNDFGIDLINQVAKNGEDESKILYLSFDNYLLNDKNIVSYEILARRMFMLNNNNCVSNRKKESTSSMRFLTQASYKSAWIKQELDAWKSEHPDATNEEIADKQTEITNSFNVNTSKLNRVLRATKVLYFNEGGNATSETTGSCYYQFGFNTNADNQKTIANKGDIRDFTNTHLSSNSPDFTIPSRLKSVTVTITYDYSTNILKISCPNASYETTRTIPLSDVLSKTLRFKFYNEYTIRKSYCYLQNITDEEYLDEIDTYRDWENTSCPLPNWTETSSFQKECDVEWNTDTHDWNYILYSRLSDNHGDWNRPVYEVKITNEDGLEVYIRAYILNYKIVFMTDYAGEMTIRPKDEIIENYFRGLKGFEKQLLTRKSEPLYSNQFITPIEYDLGYVYYKRTYTWPSNNYCIDITSNEYIDFVNKLLAMAERYDELWTDNLWRRMTHEAIKNYDWTYTRRYNEGDEEENVEGGERMHNVINVIGRVFDDIKRSIDTIKQFNRVTYNGDRNMPNALLSDKLELMGWDVYSTIPTITEVEETEDDETIETSYYTGNEVIYKQFLEDNNLWWYPTKNPENITFADVDVDWMRRFILSSKRILSTKGTINSIEMIMAMFGYGLQETVTIDENIKKPPFEIWEEYHTVRPINYDEPFDYANILDSTDIITKEQYDELSENDKQNYSLRYTIGDMIVNLNLSKLNEKLYDDDASGIPVASFVIDKYEQSQEDNLGVNYLIPFYTQEKWYDGNLYFQMNGGWWYEKSENEDENEINPFSWKETLSYLHVVSQVSDLLNVNPQTVSNGDIYYVTNVNDYYDNTETGLPLSHFFVMENEFSPEEFSSWTCIDITGKLYQDEEGETDEEVLETNKKYRDYAAKARYLNSIIPDNIGNNPHVGYGKYDKGQEYFEYMKKPFKYALDTYNFNYDAMDTAESITFDVSDRIQAGNIGNPIYMTYNLKDGETETEQRLRPSSYDLLTSEKQKKYEASYAREDEYNNLSFVDKMYYEKTQKSIVFANGYEVTLADADGGRTNLQYKEYLLNKIGELLRNKYYLNSKVLHFKNYIANEYYIDYFKKIIMKYIMQVIPSTTIVILEGFDYQKEENNDENNG